MSVRISFEIPGVRVVASEDYKGNPVSYVEVYGVPMLYAFGEEPEGLSASDWTDIFQHRLANVLAPLLLEECSRNPENTWQLESPTGREVNTKGYMDLVEE